MIKTYTRDDAVLSTSTTAAPTTTQHVDDDESGDEGGAKEQVTLSYLENRAYAAWIFFFCV